MAKPNRSGKGKSTSDISKMKGKKPTGKADGQKLGGKKSNFKSKNKLTNSKKIGKAFMKKKKPFPKKTMENADGKENVLKNDTKNGMYAFVSS